ncbi:MAG TPA: Ig-like domain-containing protein, partial [Saprospiraceae bacterium]|nr:Ig-like domain-containing protein [Saprospiraceae bacterium]
DAHCGNQDGTASVTVDPPGVYTYAWSNGSTERNQTNLAAGSYTLTVTGSGTCVDTNAIIINDIPASFNVEITNTPAHCGAADGTASANVTPAGDYLYEWSEGSTTNSVSGLMAGTYSLTVTENSTGCTKVQETGISDASSSFSINVSTSDATCGLSDGSAMVTVDPPGEYQYEWSGGQTTAAVSSLAPGVYSIKVSVPGTTCSDSMEITIVELPAAYTINTSTTPASCGLNDGTASASVDPNGPYEFSWSNGQTGPQASGLGPGTYTVTVSLPGNVCTQTADVSINQLPPSFTLGSSTTPAGCGLQDGTATAIVDPPGEYVFLWSNGQTTAQATGLAAGSYQVTVAIAGSSCQQSISITVEQSPASFTVSTTSTPAQCGLNDGTASALVDPPGEYNYLWSDGQTTQQASGLAAGNYSVTVTLAGSSCQQNGSVTVDQLQASFSVSTTSTPSNCGLNDGTATAIADPAGEYMYQWSNGQSGSQLNGLDSGQYIVSVSLVGSSCFVSDTIAVDQIPLSINANFAVTPSDCGVANGSAAITIDPAGNYTYTWSNKQTGNMLQSVPAGNYDVTVSDANSCTATFSTAVGENPAHYLDIISTTPATCVGGGDISFTLISPGAGPIQIDFTAPSGSLTLTLPPGSYLLSSLINVLPGSYNFTVFDQSIGPVCSENQTAQVTDQTPAISVTNDAYTTGSDQPVNGNVLQNDSGLNLQLTSTTNFIGGTVTFAGDGSFTYTPNSGFSGTGSFDYTVTDACGNTATGSVLITVQMVACSITITSTLTPANCDLLNGAISVSVNEPGSYQYNWSNGQTGSTINNIPAGTYTVTILETGTGCTEDFTLNLTEYPADYVSNIVITQPDCTTPGEIQFTLTTQGSAPFLSVSVDHPNGIQTFTIEPGVVVLSDYIDIVEGSYSIEVFIGDAGPDCIDDFAATINAAPAVVIQAGQITPPSSQGAMDGAVNISVTDPGVTPYSIFVNDGFYGTTSSQSFQVTGLATGFYDIHIVDATGCMSNVVMVIIPLPTIVISLGVALVNSPPAAAYEQPASGSPTYWNTGVLGSLEYKFGKRPQRLRMLYSPGYSDYHFYHPAWMQVEHLSDILSLRQKQYSLSLEGGIGLRPIYNDVNYEPVYVSLNASTQVKLGKILHLAAEVSLRGWSRLETPQWMINATFPFVK